MSHYNTDHLSVAELLAVCQGVWNHIMDVFKGNCVPMGMLEAEIDELFEEYEFWIGEYTRATKANTQGS